LQDCGLDYAHISYNQFYPVADISQAILPIIQSVEYPDCVAPLDKFLCEHCAHIASAAYQ
jgi:hypothetical protein